MEEMKKRALCIFAQNFSSLMHEAEEKLGIKIIFTYFYPGIPGGGVSDVPSKIYVYQALEKDINFYFFKWRRVVEGRKLLSISIYHIYNPPFKFEILDPDLLDEKYFLYIIKKNFDQCDKELKDFKKKQIKY